MDSKAPPLSAPSPALDVTSVSVEEEPLVDGPLIPPDALRYAMKREFQTVPTACAAVLLALLHVAFAALAACLVAECVLLRRPGCAAVLGRLQPHSLLLWGKAGLWLAALLVTACLQLHHDGARKRGYLRFYRDARTLGYLPLATHSTGNVAVLVALSAELEGDLNVYTYALLGILGLELMVAVPCLLVYTVRVVQFNRAAAGPDISQVEWTHPYSHTSLPTETGFREGSSLEEVVDKQADLIEYLKQHNTFLSRRLLSLTAQH